MPEIGETNIYTGVELNMHGIPLVSWLLSSLESSFCSFSLWWSWSLRHYHSFRVRHFLVCHCPATKAKLIIMIPVHIFKNATVSGALGGAFFTGFMFYTNLFYVSLLTNRTSPSESTLANTISSSYPNSSKSFTHLPQSCPASYSSLSWSPNASSHSHPASSFRKPETIQSIFGLALLSGPLRAVYSPQSPQTPPSQDWLGIRFSVESVRDRHYRQIWLPSRPMWKEARWLLRQLLGTSFAC